MARSMRAGTKLIYAVLVYGGLCVPSAGSRAKLKLLWQRAMCDRHERGVQLGQERAERS